MNNLIVYYSRKGENNFNGSIKNLTKGNTECVAEFIQKAAGGGWQYVGAMHDSFPHALELSKMGYNAFAIIYRPGEQTACEDLSRTLTFIWISYAFVAIIR